MNTGYVALLRGINVGGNKKVGMEELKKTFSSLGFKNVQTILNSGNVVFGTDSLNLTSAQNLIEETLEKTFGFKIPVLLRTAIEIKKLIDSDPFKNIPVTTQSRLYITFLPAGSEGKSLVSSENDLKIVQITQSEVRSFLTISSHKTTTDMMKLFEKTWGTDITTRNWNTIVRIGKVLLPF